MVTGISIANNWADLIDSTLAAPSTITEAGDSLGEDGGDVWTNTPVDGTEGGFVGSGVNCSNWSIDAMGSVGSYGGSDRTNLWWAEFGAAICSLSQRLYCFQQQ